MNNDEASEVYRNIERKRELVAMLKTLLEGLETANDALDKKAWDILSVTSATFGIVSAIEITQKVPSSGLRFWVASAVVLGLYLWQVVEVLAAVGPMTWHKVPGGARGQLSFEVLLKKYILPEDEDEYLNKLIVDYVGKVDPENRDEIIPGAIQQHQKNNEKKAKHVRKAGWLLGFIVAGLIVVALMSTNISLSLYHP
jgi:hypothetical protein